MRRRTFFRIAALGSAGALARPAFAKAPSHAASVSASAVRPFELDELSIRDLQAGLTRGKCSAVSLTKKYLVRIQEIDRNGPGLNSVIELNPDAVALASALDRERKSSGPRGPLHGIPILIKDNIDTRDRMSTTAGSLALAGSIALRDAFVVERLRAAGVVILGKTNLSEWANYRGSRSTSGWSARGGQTHNPYVLDRNPSGSSSGSGVSVAASLCAAAVGTETDGSILSPSSYNGIVGLKPTVGLISRAGIIPISSSQDTAGPMARSVTDAAILLGAMTGVDGRDAASAASEGRWHGDYTQFLDPDGLRGARIGFARKATGQSAVRRLMETLPAILQRLGAEVIDPVELPGKLGQFESVVFRYEFKAGINAYLGGLGPAAPRRTLQDLIDFNERHQETELRWFGQENFIKAQASGPLTDAAYLEARAGGWRAARDEGLDAVMNRHKLDAIISPTSDPAHTTDLIYGNHSAGGETSAAAVAGYPSLTVPAGFVHGLPVGLSFTGRAWSEPVLFRLAFAFEQATKARRAPRFLPTLPVRE